MPRSSEQQATPHHDPPVPAIVKTLGWVSFFTDAASEMLYPLIPIFLTVTLGAPATALGLVEGLADGVATGLKAAAGAIADRFRNHRLLVAIGYGLAALAKPLLAAAPNWGAVAGLRVADRTGKAIRGAPRDLMIAEAVGPTGRGRAFGFHRMMDTAGAVVGPLLALAALAVLGEGRLRTVFLLAALPGLASLALIARLPRSAAPAPAGKRWERVKLPWRSGFGVFVAATIVFNLGNSSDVFLLLRARDLGLSDTRVILAYVLYNLVYASTSLPAGIRSDRSGRLRVYGAGLVVFAAVYLGFGLWRSPTAVWPLLAVYGLYMALTDGIGRALVADLAPPEARGKALGVTQAITGACVLVAGVTAGVLWDRVSPAAPFIVGAVTSLAALPLLAVAARVGRRAEAPDVREDRPADPGARST